MTSYIVTLEEDENGDVILPFPDELIKKYGWLEGDMITWEIIDGGAKIINKSAEERNK